MTPLPGDKRARLKQWLESGEAKLHPLTFSQREIWEASSIPVGDPANHICCLIQVRGLLTPPACEAALQRVVERQEVLRLSILPGKERPLQLVRRSAEINLQFRDLSPAEREPETVEAITQEICREPFDLLQGPLYRAVMLRRATDDHVLVFAIHHVIADGWTLGVLVEDLFGAYIQGVLGMSEPLPPVPLTYSAWGAAERAFWQPAELEPRAAFWKSALAGSSLLWTSPKEPVALGRWRLEIPGELGAGIQELARRNGVTLFSTLLAAFQEALSEWTGKEDIVVGTPVANRSKLTVHETMGYCSGNVPLRAKVDRTRPFVERLREVHQMTIDSFANAMPFAELVRALGDLPAPGHHPVYQVRFALQNHPIPDVALPSISAKLRMRSTGTARFDLGCEITEQQDSLEVVWLFQPLLFSQAEMEELNQLFQAVLTNVCRAPESLTAAVP